MNTVATTHFFCNGQGRYVITVLAECWIIKGVNSYRCKGMLFFFSTCRGKKKSFLFIFSQTTKWFTSFK